MEFAVSGTESEPFEAGLIFFKENYTICKVFYYYVITTIKFLT